jgi:rfaE bifunctional protein nucleotidyltransferase chain/domain
MMITLDDLADIRAQHPDKKIVLTSGTFDLLHVGHLEYLSGVKSYGDVVVVMMSGDARVKARKGPSRPVIPEADRMEMLNALKVVDYVFIDPSKLSPDQIDPIHAEIIARLQPDMYVTDGEDIRFSKVMDVSKQAVLPRSSKQVSTSDIIEEIRRA